MSNNQRLAFALHMLFPLVNAAFMWMVTFNAFGLLREKNRWLYGEAVSAGSDCGFAPWLAVNATNICAPFLNNNTDLITPDGVNGPLYQAVFESKDWGIDYWFYLGFPAIYLLCAIPVVMRGTFGINHESWEGAQASLYFASVKVAACVMVAQGCLFAAALPAQGSKNLDLLGCLAGCTTTLFPSFDVSLPKLVRMPPFKTFLAHSESRALLAYCLYSVASVLLESFIIVRSSCKTGSLIPSRTTPYNFFSCCAGSKESHASDNQGQRLLAGHVSSPQSF